METKLTELHTSWKDDHVADFTHGDSDEDKYGCLGLMCILLRFVLICKYGHLFPSAVWWNERSHPLFLQHCSSVFKMMSSPSSHSSLWTGRNHDNVGLFSCKEKWESYPPIKLQTVALLRNKGSEQSFERGPSMVMAHIEINLCSSSVVLMLNKPCQKSFAYIEQQCGSWRGTAPLLWKHRLHIPLLNLNTHTYSQT